MTDLVHIPNHEERMLDAVLGQFNDADNLRTLIKILAEEIQQLETAVSDVYWERMLSIAVGAQLDQWGEVLSVPRSGLSDSDYRRVLLVSLTVNASSGLVEEQITVLHALTDGSVRYGPLYPAAYQLQYGVPSTNIPTAMFIGRIKEFLLLMQPAGVQLSHIQQTIVTGSPFGWLEDPDASGFDQGAFQTTVI